MIKIFITFLTLIFLSCHNPDNSKANTTVDTNQIEKQDIFPAKELFIDNGEEEGWGADIRLSITRISKTDTSVTYVANALYKKKVKT